MKRAARGFTAPAFDQGIFLLHLNKGRECLGRGDVHKARVELEEALKLRPSDEMVLNLLGMVYFRLDMRREAAVLYRNLLNLHPEADILHSNLGILEFKEGRHEEARLELTEALRLNPRNPKPHLYLGLIARLQGRDEECLDHLRSAGADALAARLASGGGRAANRPEQRLETPAGDAPAGGGVEASAGGEVVAFARRPSFAAAPTASTPPAYAPLDLRDLIESRERVRSLVGESLFALKGRRALEVAFLGRICAREGAAVLASGEMTAAPGPDGFLQLSGPGRVILAAGPGSIFLLPLAAQRVWISRPRALAWEGCVDAVDGDAVAGLPGVPLGLRGSGIFALTLGSDHLVVEMRREHSLRLEAEGIVAWTEGVTLRSGASPPLGSLMGGGRSLAVASGQGQILMEMA